MQRPKSWNDVKLRQFLDLGSLDLSDYPNLMDYNIDLVSILCDVDIEEIESLSYQDFQTLEKDLRWAKIPPKGYDEQLVDFNKISLGKFIDVEHYITDKENIPLILELLTGIDCLDLPCSEVADIVPKYIDFRERIIKAYPNIFAPQFEDEEDISEYTAEELKEIEDEKKASAHSWERFILNLCNNDITKFDAVTDMGLILVFNLFSAKS
jgi:hypothetical protein